MTTKEELHFLVEKLPDEEAERLLSALRQKSDEAGTAYRRPFEVEIDTYLSTLTAEELESLPTNIGDHLDHYVYGTPKE